MKIKVTPYFLPQNAVYIQNTHSYFISFLGSWEEGVSYSSTKDVIGIF